MYIPSGAYSGWENDVTSREIAVHIFRGESEASVPETNIVEDSLKITDNVCIGGKFHTGGVIAKQLDIRLIDYDASDLYGSRITVDVIYTLEGESTLTFPMGAFLVDIESIEKGRNGDIGLKAYDELTLLDRPVTASDRQQLDAIIAALPDIATGADFPIWKYIQFAAGKCGLTMDQAAFESLASFGWTLYTNPTGSVPSPPMGLGMAVKGGATYRDVVSSAAALGGCAVRLDRTGKLVPVSFLPRQAADVTFTKFNVIDRTVNDHYATVSDVTYGFWETYSAGIETVPEPVTLALPASVFLYDRESDYNEATYAEYVITRAVDRADTGIADDLKLRNAELTIFGNDGLDAGDYAVSQQDWLETSEIGFFIMEHIWQPHQSCTVRSFGAPSSSISTSGRDYGQVTRSSRASTSSLMELDGVAQDLSSSTGYSVNEHSVGKWLNGKTLYEKTYVFTALGDSTTREVSQNLGIHVGDIYLDEIVESKGQYIDTSVSAPLPFLPLLSDGSDVDPDKAIRFYIDLSNEKLKIVNGATDRSGCKAYITLRYTTKVITNMINLDPNDGYQDGVVLHLNNYGGYEWESNRNYATTGYIPVVPGQSYIYSHKEAWVSGHYQTALCYYAAKGGNPINGQRYPANFSNANQSWTFTAPAGVSYVRLPLGKKSGGTLATCTMYPA